MISNYTFAELTGAGPVLVAFQTRVAWPQIAVILAVPVRIRSSSVIRIWSCRRIPIGLSRLVGRSGCGPAGVRSTSGGHRWWTSAWLRRCGDCGGGGCGRHWGGGRRWGTFAAEGAFRVATLIWWNAIVTLQSAFVVV